MACGFHESDDSADPDRLAEWIHEDAEMSLAMTHFELVRGKRAIMDALYRERESVIYSARVERHEWLDETTLLVRGQVRYAVAERGVTQATIWWIDEFRDGLLWRVRAFKEENAARAAHADASKSAGNGRG
ncbi:MAG TPA: hypothetical protein VH816_07905 [Gaiellaceae bacterium]